MIINIYLHKTDTEYLELIQTKSYCYKFMYVDFKIISIFHILITIPN